MSDGSESEQSLLNTMTSITKQRVKLNLKVMQFEPMQSVVCAFQMLFSIGIGYVFGHQPGELPPFRWFW